jgi:hypothetical protein
MKKASTGVLEVDVYLTQLRVCPRTHLSLKPSRLNDLAVLQLLLQRSPGIGRR